MNEQQLRQQYEQEMALYDQYLQETGGQDHSGRSPQGSEQPVMDMPDERSPHVSFADRLLIKNLSKDPSSSFQFLQKKYPDLDLKKSGDQILVKKKDENVYKAVDPAGFDPEDVTDIGYDVASGVGQSIATAAGGVFGGLPGAMAAGAGSGAGAEILRQKLGELAGVNEQKNISDYVKSPEAVVDVGLGAVSPLIFGTGATLKAPAKSLLSKLTTVAQPEQALKQRGLVERMWDYGKSKVPAITENLTTVPERATKTLLENPELIKQVQDMGFENFAQTQQAKIRNGITGLSQHVGKTLEQAIDNLKGPVTPEDWARANSLTEKIKKVQNNIKSLDNRPPSAVDFDLPKVREEKIIELETLKKQLNDIMQAPNLIDITKARKALEDQITSLKSKSKDTPVEKDLIDALQQEYDSIFVPAPKEVERLIINPDNTVQLVKQIEKQAPIDKMTASEAFQLQQRLRDISEMYKMPTTKQIAPSFSKDRYEDKAIKSTASAAYEAINDELDRASGGLTKELKDQYKDLMILRRQLQPKFKDEQTTINTLTNIDKQSNAVLRERLKKLSDKYGIDLSKDIDALQATAYYANPSQELIKTGRSVPLAAAGGAVGYALGNELGGGQAGFIGAAVGGMGARQLASPATLKKILLKGQKASKAMENYTPRPQVINPSVFVGKNIMKDNNG